MGLTRWVTESAVRRVHVLIVEAPGHDILRMRAEAAVTARGWVAASTPADADALLVCGQPSEPYPGLIEAVWQQIPAPRVRETIVNAGGIPPALDAFAEGLRDTAALRRDAHTPVPVPPNGPDTHDPMRETHDDSGSQASDMDMSAGDAHGEMAMEASGHDMDMSGPGGIPLAEGANDRDGLEMDATHLTLGPILPAWPAGLALHCTLHGDVVTGAEVEWLGEHPTRTSDRRDVAAVLCDSVVRLLTVAGWDPMAMRIERLRNEILGGRSPREIDVQLRRVIRRLEGSRTLRWSLAGIPSSNVGGSSAVLIGWLYGAAAALADPELFLLPELSPRPRTSITDAVVGQELSTVRVIVAALGLDAETAGVPVHRG